MHEWINEWNAVFTAQPLWILHFPCSFQASLVSSPLIYWNCPFKACQYPSITNPNSLDISVAFDKPYLKFLCYWFLGGCTNLIFFLYVWSLLLCLFPLLRLLYLTSCFGGCSLFECYTTHAVNPSQEISTAISRRISVNFHSYPQLLPELQVDMLYIFKWGFTVTSNSLQFNNKSINFFLPRFYVSANEGKSIH